MKKTGFLLLFVIFLASCVSFPFDSGESTSWAGKENWKGTVRVVSVTVDKSGEWGSLEREVNDLLPLLFSEEGYLAVSGSSASDFLAGITIREREYTDGWQTKHSLSAEVRIWKGGSDTCTDDLLPMSAGRSLSNGRKSFSSSRTLTVLLRKACKNALSGVKPGNYQ